MSINKHIFLKDRKSTTADLNLLQGLVSYANYEYYGWGHFNVSKLEAIHMKCYLCTNKKNTKWNNKCPDETCPLNEVTFQQEIPEF